MKCKAVCHQYKYDIQYHENRVRVRRKRRMEAVVWNDGEREEKGREGKNEELEKEKRSNKQ